MPQPRRIAVAAIALLLLSISPIVRAAPGAEPAAPLACPVVVKNGDFEAQGANWTQSGAGSTPLVTDLNPRTGLYSAELGGANSTNHSIKQQVVLPGQHPLALAFWWEQWTQEDAPGDFADLLTINLLKTDGSLLKELARLGVDPDLPPWERLSYDISAYAGQTVQIQFLAHNDSTNPTRFFVDDVSVPACKAYLPVIRRR